MQMALPRISTRHPNQIQPTRGFTWIWNDATFVCGLIVSLGNRASAGLSPRVVLLSGGLLLQVFVNTPLTVTFVTYGAAILFLLWYIAPRGALGNPEPVEP